MRDLRRVNEHYRQRKFVRSRSCRMLTPWKPKPLQWEVRLYILSQYVHPDHDICWDTYSASAYQVGAVRNKILELEALKIAYMLHCRCTCCNGDGNISISFPHQRNSKSGCGEWGFCNMWIISIHDVRISMFSESVSILTLLGVIIITTDSNTSLSERINEWSASRSNSVGKIDPREC